MLVVFIGFFLILILSAPISGSHFNPAVTLAFMFRKDTGKFSRMLGLFYILFQYLGAIGGGFVIYVVLGA
jgi:glycerol uptake facilitator-like aquaporin